MIVYVHAFEDAPGGNAGSGGFDWFDNAAAADASFEAGSRSPSDAHFRFDVEVKAKDPEEITSEIDARLSELTAAAERRYVGSEVLAYWQANDFRMGDADGPASSAPGL